LEKRADSYDTKQSTKHAYIGPNRDERKYFDDNEVEFTLYADLTFTGSLVDSENPVEVSFNSDIQQIGVE